jgi:phosphoribosylanthranilate isomerase
VTKIKICGITNLEDALACVDAGADALGFVLAESPRRVEAETIKDIVTRLPKTVLKIGVFVNEKLETLQQTFLNCGLDYAQLQGEESGEYIRRLEVPCLKVFRVKDESVLAEIESAKPNLFMLDTYQDGKKGGTGKIFNWEIAIQAKRYGKFFLSGGLNPDNVKSAIKKVHPYGVDVSSGVEKFPGKKDLEKVREFIKRVRE